MRYEFHAKEYLWCLTTVFFFLLNEDDASTTELSLVKEELASTQLMGSHIFKGNKKSMVNITHQY